MSTFSEWLDMKPATEWHHFESWHSSKGEITKLANGEWQARVFIGDKTYRLAETFVSVESAKGAIERTWKREQERKSI